MSFSLPKEKIKILLLENIHPQAIEIFKKAGYSNIKLLKQALEGEDLQKEIEDTHIIGIRSKTTLSKEVLKNAHKLMAIGCFCIGTNQVDLNTAKERGVTVFNAPFSNTRSVAELTIGEIIMLARNIPKKNALSHRGIWQKSAEKSYEVRGKTLGIIGYGRIGTQVGILAESMGMKVKYYDTETKLPLGNACAAKNITELLETSDIVTLHVPETSTTKNFFGEKEFSQMKKGSFFLNAARGSIVDIPALQKALDTHHIQGAAIDVFPIEPASNTDEFISPLRTYDQVILTPHIGGSTEESQLNIGIEVSEKLVKYSDNGSTLSSVNIPEVSLPNHEGKHRILHIHKNAPGVMARLNAIFSDAGINISGQYLQTNESIGYVVIDSDTHISSELIETIKTFPETIKIRILY